MLIPKDRSIIIGIVIFILLIFVPYIFSSYVVGVFTIALYFAVFVMSWDLLFGYSGEVNFGSTFQIGIGAYTAAILNINTHMPLALCIVLGAVAAILSGLILVAPALRLKGPYFGLITLVSVLLLEQFVTIFAQYTGGEIGLSVPGIISVSSKINYYMALLFCAFSAMVMLVIARSPIGLILQASAQDPIEAESLGFNITKYKVLAFGISALFSGLSGALLVFYLGTASVSLVVSIAVVLQIIISAIIGGRRTIIGPILGAFFIILLREWLQPLGQLSYVVVSIMGLIVLLFLPDGIISLFLRKN
ncbi:MAG: branched-chain amino acid ABC transporter permease [Desulfurella sp.]|uniref:Branched-chain amino acid transport system permease protein n=1 Tax=Desulfurella multipotens TaxID=79269 RepID=A0A1G6ND92_9BACT|nr:MULTISPECIES: branched-chain amino acid ABC transporter permease [Desulfurella]PMP67967.1 MAG: branched-chain amino acid ABC transporter permease [Desulfurella multipotens]SDC65155.1 branched-chain amino acid transport system permease protein [Desulfurella multipotens]